MILACKTQKEHQSCSLLDICAFAGPSGHNTGNTQDENLMAYPFMDRAMRRVAGNAVIVTSVESAKAYMVDLVMKQHFKAIPSSESINNPMRDTIWVWNTGR